MAVDPEDRAGIYLSKAFFTTWSRSGSAALQTKAPPSQSRICSPLAVFHDLRRGDGRLNNTWEVDSSLGLALNRKTIRRRAALLRPASIHPRVSVQICTDFPFVPGIKVYAFGGGFLGFCNSTVKPEAYHFWGIIDSPCFRANKLRGSIGNLRCMSIGVARHAHTRAGFP